MAVELEAIRAKHNLPCLAVIALRGDTVVAEGYVGVRKLGDATPITRDDRFHLGSDTKAMTATLLGLLVDEGKLTWSTTLREIFAKSSVKLHAAWNNVTVAQVLAHRAGLRANLPPAQRGAEFGRLAMPQRREVLIREVLSQPPQHSPGTKYLYSNVGYILAGVIIERLAHDSWEQLMVEWIFKPLDITSAGFGPPGTPGKADQPWGHSPDGAPIDPGSPRSDNPKVVGPAGTAHMTMRDWAKFVALHLRSDAENPHREVKLLKPESFGALHTPASGETYMGGWVFLKRPWAKGDQAGNSGRVFQHAGSNTLWFCIAWVAPEIDFAVLVATNQAGENGPKGCDDAAGTMIRKFAKTAAGKD